MSAATNKVLVKMLDRLFAALVNGPSLNARPHNSRQRVDFAQLGRLGDISPDEALRRLLGEARQVRVAARVPVPKRRGGANGRGRFGKRGNGIGNGSREEASGGAAAPGSGEPESRLTEAERRRNGLFSTSRHCSASSASSSTTPAPTSRTPASTSSTSASRC